jgi:protein-tyrosine phosphatase
MRVLFVCLGNICRSPTAEAVLRAVHRATAPGLPIEVDSAGTGDYHIGEPPDFRAQAAARRRGYDMSGSRARLIEAADFERFDLILAMDRANVADLRRLAPPAFRDRVRLFLEFAAGVDETEVPDPYYGGATGFEQVLDLVEAAARGLIEHVRSRATRNTIEPRRPEAG